MPVPRTPPRAGDDVTDAYFNVPCRHALSFLSRAMKKLARRLPSPATAPVVANALTSGDADFNHRDRTAQKFHSRSVTGEEEPPHRRHRQGESRNAQPPPPGVADGGMFFAESANSLAPQIFAASSPFAHVKTFRARYRHHHRKVMRGTAADANGTGEAESYLVTSSPPEQRPALQRTAYSAFNGTAPLPSVNRQARNVASYRTW